MTSQKCCKVLLFWELKSLGVERERKHTEKVAYVLRFCDPKSLGAHSGDRSFCVFAYLTALLGGHFCIFAYLTALLRGFFHYFSLVCKSPLVYRRSWGVQNRLFCKSLLNLI